jgi:hypothetical protein
MRRGDSIDKEAEKDLAPEALYLPGLLKAKVLPRTKDAPTAASDSALFISKDKARELNLESGDIVGIIGRRRRVLYTIVTVSKNTKSDEFRF